MDINSVLETLEKRLDCQLVYHDVRYIFFYSQAVQCDVRYRNILSRYPDFCTPEDEDDCVEHCVIKLRRKVRLENQSFFYWRCPQGNLQVVAPVFRDDVLTGLLFAGIWRRPFPKAHIREIASLLPILAEGLTARMERTLSTASPRKTLRARILDILDKNYAKPLTISFLAKQLSLSPSRASHVVKEEFKQSFSQLLRDIRLEKASQMLLSAPARVNEVGLACGFGSVNYFSSAFQKAYGISPRLWQQQMAERRNAAAEAWDKNKKADK